MRPKITFISLLVLAVWPLSTLAVTPFTRTFPLGDCTFLTEGNNPYFKLQVGRELHLDNAACVESDNCDELEEVVITVLNETEDIDLMIDGEPTTVTTRVVEENESVDGELEEISRNFFAECEGTGDVYYFGEEVDIYEDDVIVSNEGAWRAGVDGAKPGLFMPGGAFLLGARYFQELAPDVAMDRAENVKMGLNRVTPAGTFNDCVRIKETTPLEPSEVSIKYYCAGVGIVFDDGIKLTDIVE
ncbi:MAG: hypothetical protein HYY48_10160 [Gammaproteobacteria bacterium]|nr:hypothetical protein [Gammaproteobacteria bacterium]